MTESKELLQVAHSSISSKQSLQESAFALTAKAFLLIIAKVLTDVVPGVLDAAILLES